MWTSTRPEYNKADRERSHVKNGRLVIERIPQTGSQGEYDNRQPITSVRRWLPMLNHGGHEVPVVFTNAAADLNNTGPFAQYQWAMTRAMGWFWIGACPVALASSGELRTHMVVDQAILDDQPCALGTYGETNPCKHVASERAARARQNAENEAAREQAYKTDTDRQIAAQRDMNAQLIAAQGTQQRELIEVLLSRMPAPAQVGLGADVERQLQALRDENQRLLAAIEATQTGGPPAPPTPAAEPKAAKK